MTLSNLILVVVMGLVIKGSSVLISNLGAETVPTTVKPLAQKWIRSGRDPKWIRLSMWILFFFLASIFVTILLFGMYRAALQLGMEWSVS